MSILLHGRLRRIDGTTWAFEAFEAFGTRTRLGLISYPGNDPDKNYHAFCRDLDVGHHATLDQACTAIDTKLSELAGI